MKKPLHLLVLGVGLGLAFTAATAVSEALAPQASAATVPEPAAPAVVAAEPVEWLLEEPSAHAEAPAPPSDPGIADASEATADADSAPASASDVESSAGPGSPPAPEEPRPGAATWTLYADGYCANGAECAQAAVDSSTLAFIDYGPLLWLYAGHDYGPAGIIASMSIGDTVDIFGVAPGRFTIVGTTYVHRGARIDAVSGIGLQTCVGDQMVVHTLESVP